ncbi:hypothetical protein CBR_g45625 [Chara braunii]|uniref:Uncharacterized protein n=1 Tax=Chara braunii TaxID=69332 RepID=A0A388LZ20_CHABU|nr:hypothetical protein CBR_g45625 [Chara braunii]|eukprot:GBG87567.1 hypothetical protein CBR_g45625 [Chara braunii]
MGIDLGTSFCCVAIYRDFDTIEVVPNDLGFRITPSAVAFVGEECLVGESAKRHGRGHPKQCIFEVKRLMGRSFLDEHVQQDAKVWPFRVVPGPRNEALVEVQVSEGKPDVPESRVPTRTFRPEEISAILLKEMRRIAETYAGGETITDAVITVPAYFNDAQRQATRDAGTRAGLNVLRLMNEPTAAALAYGRLREMGRGGGCVGKKIMVFDLGGGTFDVSIITITAGADEESSFLVNAVAGDGHLGGADFDGRLLAHVLEQLRKQYGTDFSVSSNPNVMTRLKAAVVEAKHALSGRTETEIELDYGETTLSVRVGRAAFEDMNGDHFDNCKRIMDEAVSAAGVKRADIAEVILVGGSTRIPRVQELVTQYFGRKPLQNVHPDEAVAYGAALQAGLMASGCFKCDEATPDHAGGGKGTISVRDVTPLSIGTDFELQEMGVLIPRNTPLPAKGSMDFACVYDYQSTMSFALFEGERALCGDNRFLGLFTLQGFTGLPANGKPVTRLLVRIDEDGILHATAEATANHIQLGRQAGVQVRTGIGVLNKEGAHAITSIAQAMATITPDMKLRDDALRAAFKARRELQRLAWRLRDEKQLSRKSGRKKAAMASRLANQVLNWMLSESNVAPRDEYDKRISELKALDRR